MPDLNPEQVAELEGITADKTPQCPYCLISEGRLEANKVYEDNEFIAALEIRPANPGHVVLFPKKHFQNLKEMADDLSESFLALSSKIAKALLNVSEGVNILLSSGKTAGQTLDHITINIIPRFKDDNVMFGWNPKQIGESQMKQLAEAISSALVSRAGSDFNNSICASASFFTASIRCKGVNIFGSDGFSTSCGITVTSSTVGTAVSVLISSSICSLIILDDSSNVLASNGLVGDPAAAANPPPPLKLGSKLVIAKGA